MHSGRLVFAQLMEFLPRHEFNTCVRRFRGDYRVRGFTCRDQFQAMAFAQLTFRESLRQMNSPPYRNTTQCRSNSAFSDPGRTLRRR